MSNKNIYQKTNKRWTDSKMIEVANSLLDGATTKEVAEEHGATIDAIRRVFSRVSLRAAYKASIKEVWPGSYFMQDFTTLKVARKNADFLKKGLATLGDQKGEQG